MRLLESLQEHFAAYNVQAFLVGGFVRDSLLGRPSRDVDVAIVGGASEIARQLAGAPGGNLVPLDPQRGIFRVLLRSSPEHTAPWTIDLTSAPQGIAADLEHRDFTIDAMAVPFPQAAGTPASWPIIDPLHGRADLDARVLRAIGPGVFQDDPLRLLRAVRLAVQLGLEMEVGTRRLLSQDAHLLSRVSGERLRDELLAILSQPGVERSLEILDYHGILANLVPELTPAKGVTQPFEHYWDVYEHSLQCTVMLERILDPQFRRTGPVGQCIPWPSHLDHHFQEEVSDGHTRATLLKLAALLHDVAKPETKTVEPSGRARFLGHSERGAEKAEHIMQRLRLSRRGVDTVCSLIAEHLRPSHLAQRGEMPTPRAIYRYFRDLGDIAIDTLYLHLADHLAARGPALDIEKWRFSCNRIAFTLEQSASRPQPQGPAKLLDGHDLIQRFGLRPGPSFRGLLEAVREAQALGEISTRDQAMHLAERMLQETDHKSGRGVEVVGQIHA